MGSVSGARAAASKAGRCTRCAGGIRRDGGEDESSGGTDNLRGEGGMSYEKEHQRKVACHMRRSIKGQLAQTTSSSTLCKDVRKVLSRPARLPLPHALIRSARGGGGGGGGEVGGGSPGPVPTASRALRPGQKEAMGAATPPALPMSRRENWPGPLLRARLDLPRSSRRLPELVYLIALRLSLFSLFL